jgi:predicted enzyme related to lactoylglutathione lyase
MIEFAHTNIIAKDWKRLAEFYVIVFDCILLEPERDLNDQWLTDGSNVPKAHLKGVHLRLPGKGQTATLEIFTYSSQEPTSERIPNKEGFGHIAFKTDDVEVLQKKALQHGATTLGKIVNATIEGAGNITWTYIKDPEGNIVELQHWS